MPLKKTKPSHYVKDCVTEMHKKIHPIQSFKCATINHVIAIAKIGELEGKKLVLWVNLTHHGSQRVKGYLHCCVILEQVC